MIENPKVLIKNFLSKPSQERDFKIDPYSEKEIELQYLNSKPSCFILMGKPGAGCSSLAKLFVDEFQCEYVNGKELIEQHLEAQTDSGKKLKDILKDGGLVTEDMVIELIQEKIASPEVAQRGYLLDDFPNASFTNFDIADQFNLLKSFKMTPDFLIYLKIPDIDLKNRLVSQRIDPQTGDFYFKQNYDPDFPPSIEVPPQIVVKKVKTGDEEEEEEDAEEEMEEEGETKRKSNSDFQLLDLETIAQLLRQPEDFPNEIEAKFVDYSEKAADFINDYIDNFNSLNVINLNANLSPTELFKQLMERLRYYPIRPAAVPIELYHVAGEDEEEETPDGSDIDELFRELSSKNCPAPGFRWQRSEWMNYCPVALHQGILQPGKPQFAVGFLNKVYILSTKERMEQFVRNPRPYLMPTQPEIPCKIAIVGPRSTGKSTLAHLLAHKYNATVIDMKVVMKPHDDEARRNYLATVLEKSTKDSIAAVHQKNRQQLELERTEVLAGQALLALEENAVDAIEENSKTRIINEEVVEEELTVMPEIQNEDTIQDPVSIEEEIVRDLPEKLPEIFVDETHPEVQELVKIAMAAAEKQDLPLPLELFMEEIEKQIKLVDDELRNREPNNKIHGCWILDNWPNRRDQWTALMESEPDKFLIPDQILVLQDSSENFESTLKRWYKNNKDEVDAAISARAGEKLKDSGSAKPDQEVVLLADDELPPPGPEINTIRKEISEWVQDWAGVASIISGSNAAVDVIELNVNDKSVEEMFQAAQKQLERIFKPVAWEMSGADIEEEEEDEAAAADETEEAQEEEEEESNEEEPNRSKKKPLGDTNYFCPVALKTQGVLWPGNSEIAAKYLGKTYFFSDEDNREKFLQEPLDYIPVQHVPKAPALRLCILGAKGSGKTTHGRKLAQKWGLFHISFHEILQEYILPRNKKKIGPEYKDTDDIPDFILPDPLIEEMEKVSHDTDEKSENLVEKENAEETVMAETAEGEKNVEELPIDIQEDLEEWDEQENAVKENLESQQPLSTELLTKFLNDFWTKQPFEKKGFILEGFPRTAEEAQFLSENGLFVDGVISLQTSEDDILARLLPPRLAKWRDRKARKDLYKKKKAEYNAKKKQLKMERRRKEIIAELEEKRNKKYGPNKVQKMETEEEIENEEDEPEDEEDLEEEVNIDDMLAEEFEEEEEPEDEEDEDDDEETAREQMENEIREAYENDFGEITGVIESFTEMQVPRFEIEAGEKPTIVQYRIMKKMKKMLDKRESIFERCYPVTPANAALLIKSGHKQLSRFGRWCPVRLLKDKNPFMPLVDDTHPTFPVIYRNYIYFTSSKQARDLFMTNPLHYLKQPSPKDAIPIKMCILGMPKSGKTTVARRFVNEYGVMRISGGGALRWVLNENWNTDLAKEIRSYLINGLIVPHELVVKSIELLMMDSQCTTRGYVLDGYPLAFDQIKLMHDREIIPLRVFELVTCPRELILRANNDRKAVELPFPMHDSSKVVAIKMANYSNNISDIRQWYGEEHANIRSIDGEKGTWFIWEQVNSDIKEQIVDIQNYFFDHREGRAANIYNLGVRPSEFQLRLSSLKEYCPVSLSRNDELVHLNQEKDLRFAAEYKGHYYKLKGFQELAIFYDHAEEILKSAHLPVDLPSKIDPYKIQDLFPMQLDLQGYCPVCFLDGKCRYEGLILGNKEKYIVEYRNKLYTFCSDACLYNFMKKPAKYWGLELPKKLPPVKSMLNIKSLPLPGYLEQTMADALRNALTATGTLKPKYPFIDPSRSALLYMALHLKAYNPKSPEHLRKKYKHKLEEFEDCCELIKYLSEHMTLKYKEVEHRPIGFDKKMAEFLRLKKLIDNEERWIN